MDVPKTFVYDIGDEVAARIVDGDSDLDRQVAFETMRMCDKVGYPAFVRTGLTSGKHEWKRTCGVETRDENHIREHIRALAEFSAIADLPMTEIAVREMLRTEPLFHAFYGMPVVPETRIFARNGTITHAQPYWPASAILHPDVDDWEARLERANREMLESWPRLCEKSADISRHPVFAPDEWSIDWLKDRDGKWWCIDMALGEMSYRHDS